MKIRVAALCDDHVTRHVLCSQRFSQQSGSLSIHNLAALSMPRAWVGKSIAYLTQNEDSSIRLQQAMKSLEALRGVLKYSCRKEKLNEDL